MAELLKIKQYQISNELFEKGYPAGTGPCTCTSQCCTSGVWVDVREREVILNHASLIQQHMDETQTADIHQWFETEIEDDPDFPSGRCVGTAVINGKCAFLDTYGRCTLQLAATASGRHRWAWKPMYCVLFPIVVENSVIQFDPMLQGKQSCCSVSKEFDVPLFEACKDELVYLLGEDGYAQMEQHYASLQASSKTPITT